MARKEIMMEELVEVLYQWHMGRGINQIKRSTGMARKTIRKYLELAEGHGFTRDMEIQAYQYYLEFVGRLQRSLKTPIEVSDSYKKTSLYQATIEKLMSKKYMTPKQAYRILKRDHDYPLSYSSFNRYINIKHPKSPRNCLRIEVKAGEEGQVDFGSAGLMYDLQEGRMRRAHAFVMTLSYSRLPYVEFVFDQGQVTWVQCHINAFEFFGGIPARVILDNLKSGILKPNTYDPVFNRAYAECAKHYGFVIDPANIGKGEHKGKVERRIPVVRQQFLSSYDFRDIREASGKVKDWCLNDYGMELHGTIKRKPYEVFKAQEQPALRSLPGERFEIPLWKDPMVHVDHHIVFDKSYYSLPTRYVGKKVWARGGTHIVQIFYDGELIKSHPKSYKPGTRVTDENDYPPEKSKYLLKTVSYYQKQASTYGEHVCRLVTVIMTKHAYRNLRKIQGIFRLAEKYGNEALNLTCKRCLYYEDYRMNTIKRILDKQLYLLEDPGLRHQQDYETTEAAKTNTNNEELTFLRSSEYFKHTMEESN